MKPLYLDGVRSLQVSLDGPALCVKGPGRADGRYPLARLSRVVVSGRVEWQTPAFLACLRNGIPITFLDGNGDAFGFCFGIKARERPLRDRLIEFLARPDWSEHYCNWYTATERRAILSVIATNRITPPDLRPVTVQHALITQLRRLVPEPELRHAHRQLKGLLAALVAELLQRTGLPRQLLIRERGRPDLIGDFTRLLEWELHTLLRRLQGSRVPRSDTRALPLIHAFEAHTSRLEHLFRGYLSSLEQWLRDQDI